MDGDGWIAPEFEPDRRNRLRTVPSAVAWTAGALVVLLVTAMAGVATRAYFSPSVVGPGPVAVDPAVTSVGTEPPQVLGSETTPTPSTGADGSRWSSTTISSSGSSSGSDGSREPVPGTTPTTVADRSPERTAPPASTTTAEVPSTTVPVDPPEPPVPVASRSENQCPVVSIARGAERSTVLVVNLRSTPLSLDVNGGRIDVEPDGCHTLTVDAVPDVDGGPDVVTVLSADPACAMTVSGSLVVAATSYELQVWDTTARCGSEAVADLRLFEAVLWRAVPPSTGPSGA